jgi:uncharacterized C2H2 Zn-finger protein
MSAEHSDEKQHICNFCEKIFKSKYNLKSHIEKNKKCMLDRGQDIVSEFVCQNCDYVAMFKNDLTKHINICKVQKVETGSERLLKEKDKQIAQLHIQLKRKDDIIREKDQIIKDLAEKAIVNAKPAIHNNTTNTSTSNTTINNLQMISEEHIKDHAKNLTLEHIKKGALGYSEYFLEYPLKERIACTDYSRRKLKYKNEQGEIVTDPEMTTLSDLLFKSIKDRNRELTIQYTNELTDKFKTAKDPTQLSYFMEVAGKFSQQDLEVFRMFNGDKNDFFHDILRNICSKTIAQ